MDLYIDYAYLVFSCTPYILPLTNDLLFDSHLSPLCIGMQLSREFY